MRIYNYILSHIHHVFCVCVGVFIFVFIAVFWSLNVKDNKVIIESLELSCKSLPYCSQNDGHLTDNNILFIKQKPISVHDFIVSNKSISNYIFQCVSNQLHTNLKESNKICPQYISDTRSKSLMKNSALTNEEFSFN